MLRQLDADRKRRLAWVHFGRLKGGDVFLCSFPRSELVDEFVGHVFNVPISTDFEHVENVLHEKQSTKRGAWSVGTRVKSERNYACFDSKSRITAINASTPSIGNAL